MAPRRTTTGCCRCRWPHAGERTRLVRLSCSPHTQRDRIAPLAWRRRWRCWTVRTRPSGPTTSTSGATPSWRQRAGASSPSSSSGPTTGCAQASCRARVSSTSSTRSLCRARTTQRSRQAPAHARRGCRTRWSWSVQSSREGTRSCSARALGTRCSPLRWAAR